MLASLKVFTAEHIEMMTDSMGYDANWELKPRAGKKAKPGPKQPSQSAAYAALLPLCQAVGDRMHNPRLP